jgi:UDP-glucose 4-epimerase
MVIQMKSLVTGCAGFIGSHLVEKLLREKHEVVGIDSFNDYYKREIKKRNIKGFIDNENFRFIEGDINNIDLSEEVEGVDYVFHLAAQPGVRTSWGDRFIDYTSNNVLATQRLLEAVKEKKLKCFVYASSSSVYGDVEKLPMRESDLPKPISPYGVTKLAGEHLCYLYWKNFGVPTISLRYFSVYGPRQRPDMAFHKFVKAILEKKEIAVYGNGTQTRDFTYIDDIVEANLLAKERGKPGEVYNIGGGSRISINQVIVAIEKITGRKAKIEYKEQYRGDVKDTYADVFKIERDLGYSARVKLEKGLQKYITWLSKM